MNRIKPLMPDVIRIDNQVRSPRQALDVGRTGDLLRLSDGTSLQFLPEAFDMATWDLDNIPGYVLPEVRE